MYNSQKTITGKCGNYSDIVIIYNLESTTSSSTQCSLTPRVLQHYINTIGILTQADLYCNNSQTTEALKDNIENTFC